MTWRQAAGISEEENVAYEYVMGVSVAEEFQ